MTTEQLLFIEVISNSIHLYGLNEELRLTIACQFALESNYGKSKLVATNLNYCGMKMPKIRPTIAISEYNGYAKYASTNDCIKDYIIWLLWNKPTKNDLNNAEQYLDFIIRNNYAEDKNYKKKILQIYKNYGK